MSSTLRIAVVGLGNMGSAHAESLIAGNVPEARLTAVCDTAEARRVWATEHLPDVAVFDDFGVMLDADVADAVIIATPHYLHPPMAVLAFQKGLHVLSEKPGGVQVSEVRKMCQAADASGKVFGVMFNQRTHPLFQRARQIVQNGELGELKRLQWTVTNWYRTQKYYDSGSWRASWAGEGGGVLINQAPHQLDLWQWIFGMPSAIWANCTCAHYHHIEVEDDATIFARYENGATATFITTTGESPGTNRLEIVGDLGKLVLEENKLRWWRLECHEREACFDPSGKEPTFTYQEILPDHKEEAHNGILRNFVSAVLHGTPLLAPGHDALQELTISNAAYLSAWTGEIISLPMDEERFNALLAERVAHSSYHPTNAVSEADGTYKARWNVSW
ncbi:MAG: Gfo/Idh/MocA family oxidoreductase [Ruminococcaceae bacterium]|nr:Gfo/Idh/MocA family oxidoreductase [Oscillospiraceae bacterium]